MSLYVFLFRCRSMTCSQIGLKNIPKPPSKLGLAIPMRSAEATASRNDSAKSSLSTSRQSLSFIEWSFTIWILNGICTSMSGRARSLAYLCLYLSLVDWLVWSVIVGWVFCWCGFRTCSRWVCWVSTYLRCVFLGWDFFFFFGWLCYIFGLIWYFGVLGFDHDFAGFEKSLPLSFMILFLSWNFLGFLCVCFLRNFLGLLVCLLGNNMIFMC